MSKYRRQEFSLKHRLVATVSGLCNFSYTIRHGPLKGLRRKGGLGFLPFGTQETEEDRFLSSLELRGKTVYDIGAFEGMRALFFARQAKRVICYEPNTRNLERLRANLLLNSVSNVTVRDVGVSDEASETVLFYDPLMPGAASADRNIGGQMVAGGAAVQKIGIKTVALDDDIERGKLPAPDFVKIDIEGLELRALRGMQRTLQLTSPALHIEIHGADFPEKERNISAVAQYLGALDYQIRHVESGKPVTAEQSAHAREGHIYATPAGNRVNQSRT